MTSEAPQRLIINRHDGGIATVGDVPLGAAAVRDNGISVSIGDGRGVGHVSALAGVSVHDIAAGLRAAGACASELAAIFDLLRQAGALAATVEIRCNP